MPRILSSWSLEKNVLQLKFLDHQHTMALLNFTPAKSENLSVGDIPVLVTYAFSLRTLNSTHTFQAISSVCDLWFILNIWLNAESNVARDTKTPVAPTRRGLRGHFYKILQGASHRRTRGSAFLVRILNYGIRLPASVVTAPSANVFKKSFPVSPID